MNPSFKELELENDVLRRAKRIWYGIDKLEDEHPHLEEILPGCLELVKRVMEVSIVAVTYVDHFGRPVDVSTKLPKSMIDSCRQLTEINRKILETSARSRRAGDDGYFLAAPLIPYKQKLVGAIGVFAPAPIQKSYESLLDDAAMLINTLVFRGNHIVASRVEDELIEELNGIMGAGLSHEIKRRKILEAAIRHTDSKLGYWLHVKKGFHPTIKDFTEDQLELLYSWGVKDLDVSRLKFSDVMKKAVRVIKTPGKTEIYKDGAGELKYALACELKLSELNAIGGAIVLYGSYPYNEVRRHLGEVAVKSVDDFVILNDENIRLLEEKQLVKDIFGGMVGPELMDVILQTKGSLNHTSRFIAMMVADISGSTAAAESASNAWIEVENMVAEQSGSEAEVAIKLEDAVERTKQFAKRLNEYLMIPAQSIIDHSGSIDKYIGDAVFGVWGAPTDQKNISFKALMAAWEAKQKVDEFNAALVRAGETTFNIKFVLNCGRAIAGLYGCPARPTYTVISDSVNTLFRVEKFAHGGEIIVTEDFLERVEDKVDCVLVGEKDLKGKTLKVKLYKILGIKGLKPVPKKTSETGKIKTRNK